MEVRLSLALPRDEISIPVVRRVLAEAMNVLGVTDDCRSDIEIAITEACTNVLHHARAGDDYEVEACVDAEQCVIRVFDRGHGFDASEVGRVNAHDDAETGRGIQLMRALVDAVHFEHQLEQGTVVRLEKQLEFAPEAPITRLNEKGGHATR